MKKIVFFNGSWDLINVGHIRAFALAKSYGDWLVVGINTDDLIRSMKKREPIMPFSQRKEIIHAIRWIDEVVPNAELDATNQLRNCKAKVYVLTEEWQEQNKQAIEYMESINGQVVFSPRWNDILCSTDLRAKIIEGVK